MDPSTEDSAAGLEELGLESGSKSSQPVGESMSSSTDILFIYPDDPEEPEQSLGSLDSPDPVGIIPTFTEIWYEPSAGSIVDHVSFDSPPSTSFNSPGLSRLAIAAIETATDIRNSHNDTSHGSGASTAPSKGSNMDGGSNGDTSSNSDEDTGSDSDPDSEGEDDDDGASDEPDDLMAINLHNDQSQHSLQGQTRLAGYYASRISRSKQPLFLRSRVYERSPLARELKLVVVRTPRNMDMELLVWQVHPGNGVQGDNHPQDSFEGNGKRYCESCRGDCTWMGMMS